MYVYSIGDYIGMRRKQATDYNFDNYVEELEKGFTTDPQSPNKWNAELPVQNMMKASPTLEMVGLSNYHIC